MKTKKRTARRRVMAVILAILALYVVYCAAISIQLGSLVRQSNNSMGEYTGQFGISAEDFKALCYRYRPKADTPNHYDEEGYRQQDMRSPVLTLSWFTGGRSVFWYNSDLWYKGNATRGTRGAAVYISFDMDGLRPVITDIYEPIGWSPFGIRR